MATCSEEVKRVIVDFLFQQWWYPMLISPTEYGLIRQCTVEFGFWNNLLSFIKLLKGVLYNRLIEDESDFAKEANQYIQSKSYKISIIDLF